MYYQLKYPDTNCIFLTSILLYTNESRNLNGKHAPDFNIHDISACTIQSNGKLGKYVYIDNSYIWNSEKKSPNTYHSNLADFVLPDGDVDYGISGNVTVSNGRKIAVHV